MGYNRLHLFIQSSIVTEWRLKYFILLSLNGHWGQASGLVLHVIKMIMIRTICWTINRDFLQRFNYSDLTRSRPIASYQRETVNLPPHRCRSRFFLIYQSCFWTNFPVHSLWWSCWNISLAMISCNKFCELTWYHLVRTSQVWPGIYWKVWPLHYWVFPRAQPFRLRSFLGDFR